MPVVNLVKPLCVHPSLPTPDLNIYGEGTVYACDDCGKQFELQRRGISGVCDGGPLWYPAQNSGDQDWILAHGPDATIQQILNWFLDFLLEISNRPMNESGKLIGPLLGAMRGMTNRFGDEAIQEAITARGTPDAPWIDVRQHVFRTYQILSAKPSFCGDLDANLTEWMVSRDDRSISYVINEAKQTTDEVRRTVASWALNSLCEQSGAFLQAAERLGWTSHCGALTG